MRYFMKIQHTVGLVDILKKYEIEVDGWLAEMPIRKKWCQVRLAGLAA